VINDKSQGSTAKHLSCDELLHYRFIIQFAGEIFLNIWCTSGELTSKVVDRIIRPVHLQTFVFKDAELAR